MHAATPPPATSSRPRPAWLLPVAVGLVSLGLRLWVLADQRAGNPLFRTAILDDLRYLEIARGTAGSDAWFHGPLYPWVLTLLGATELVAACAINAFVGVATSVAAALVARSLHSGGAGWIAGLLHAAAGVFVFHDVLPGPAALLCFLHVCAFGLSVAWYRRGAWWLAGLAGLAVGLAVMGRATSLALVPGGLLLAWRAVLPRRRCVAGIAVAGVGTLLVLVPAAFRNLSVVGEFTPFQWNGGVNAYLANGPESRRTLGVQSSRIGYAPHQMDRNSRRIAEKAEGRSLLPSEVSRYWLRRAWEERGEPAELAAHLGKKALLFWWHREYPGNHSVEVERHFATWLQVAPTGAWWLLALGVGGWFVVRPRRREIDFAAVTVVFTWVAFTLMFPIGRYRLPAVTLATIVAAVALAEAARRSLPTRRMLASAALTLGVSIAAFVPTWAGFLAHPEASSAANLAVAAARAGRLETAVEVVERALADDPDSLRLLSLHARLLTDLGRTDEARAVRDRLDELGKSSPVHDVRRVFTLAAEGNTQDAEALGVPLLEEALAAPIRAELLANLAFTAFRAGDEELARDRLAEARELAPQHPHVARVANLLRGQ